MNAVAPVIDPAAVLKLPAATRRAILDALLSDSGTHGVVHLELPDGPLHRYLPPPNARELAEESFRHATPEELAESARLADAPDSEFLSVEELLRAGEEDDTRG